MGVKLPENAKRKDIAMLDPREILEDEGWNYRTYYDPEKFEELVLSVIENGVITPLHCWVDDNRKAHVNSGHHRRKAAIEAIRRTGADILVPVVIEPAKSSQVDRMFSSMITNSGEPPRPIERAEAFRRLVNWGVDLEEIAKRSGLTVKTVEKTLELLSAAPAVIAALRNNEISTSEARRIQQEAGNDIAAQQERLARVKEASQTPEGRRELREERKEQQEQRTESRRGGKGEPRLPKGPPVEKPKNAPPAAPAGSDSPEPPAAPSAPAEAPARLGDGESGYFCLLILAGIEGASFTLTHDANSAADPWVLEYSPKSTRQPEVIRDSSEDVGALINRIYQKARRIHQVDGILQHNRQKQSSAEREEALKQRVASASPQERKVIAFEMIDEGFGDSFIQEVLGITRDELVKLGEELDASRAPAGSQS